MTYADFDQFVTTLCTTGVTEEAQQRSLDQFVVSMETQRMTVQGAEDLEEDVTTPLSIPVVKAKTTMQVDTGRLPEHVYREAMVLGLKVILNRGQTKLTKAAYPNADQLQAAALEKAEETLEAMYAGKIRVAGGVKSDKAPREVMTEARRIARALVKDQLKRAGVKVSYVESSEITKAANALIAADPGIMEQATEEVEKRAKQKVQVDIGSIPISQKKVKAAEARKADKALSAKQTARVATRARPQL